MVFGSSGHQKTLSSWAGCAAGCGGEGAEGGDGIGDLIGETGEDRRLSAEDGGFGAQRLQRVEALAPAFSNGSGEELAQILELVSDPGAHKLGQRLVGVRINLARPGMDQGDGNALSVERPRSCRCAWPPRRCCPPRRCGAG